MAIEIVDFPIKHGDFSLLESFFLVMGKSMKKSQRFFSLETGEKAQLISGNFRDEANSQKNRQISPMKNGIWTTDGIFMGFNHQKWGWTTKHWD